MWGRTSYDLLAGAAATAAGATGGSAALARPTGSTADIATSGAAVLAKLWRRLRLLNMSPRLSRARTQRRCRQELSRPLLVHACPHTNASQLRIVLLHAIQRSAQEGCRSG